MKTEDYLNKMVNVIIERPIDSIHPDKGFKYLVNYGYIPNTIGRDGEAIDAYILGIDKPIKEYKGKCIAIIKRLDDEDDKLIVVPIDKDYTNEEIIKAINFREKEYKSELIR